MNCFYIFNGNVKNFLPYKVKELIILKQRENLCNRVKSYAMVCLLAEVTVKISGLYSNAISPSHLLFSHIFNYNQVKPTVL